MKKIMSMVLLLAMGFSLVACGGKTASPSEAAPGKEAVSAGTSKAAPANEGEYAVILKVLSSQFWQSMKKGIETEAEKLGIKVDIYAANSEDDVEGQVALLENAISKGYKAIGVAPISADNLNNAIADATAKGIYVVNIDEKVNLEGLQALNGTVYSFVATDNVAVGRMGAQYIVDQITSGEVAVIEGKAGAASGENRKDGATQAFTGANGIKLVESQPADWDRTKAFDLASNYLSKYPNLKGIYCCNDTMAMGALEAVKASGKNVLVVGTDGNDDAVASVRAGELAATVAQDPAGIGARSLQLMVQAVKDGAKIDVKAEPITENVAAVLLTKETA